MVPVTSCRSFVPHSTDGSNGNLTAIPPRVRDSTNAVKLFMVAGFHPHRCYAPGGIAYTHRARPEQSPPDRAHLDHSAITSMPGQGAEPVARYSRPNAAGRAPHPPTGP